MRVQQDDTYKYANIQNRPHNKNNQKTVKGDVSFPGTDI